MPFRIIRNDITKVKADAIVNTANPGVTIGAGVDGAIYEAAGREELLSARAKIGTLAPGEVGITEAFRLGAKYILHVSGPWWEGGKSGEEQILRQCYDRALLLASEKGCESIAFPLLATGSYGFPKKLGIEIAVEAFTTFLEDHEMEITLVVFEKESVRISGELVEEVSAFIDEGYVQGALDREYEVDNRHTGVLEGFLGLPLSLQSRKSKSSQEEITLQKKQESSEPAVKWNMGASAAGASLQTGLDDILRDMQKKSFESHLQMLINKKGLKNSEVYAAANISKQYFSKLLKGQVKPSKEKALALALGLRLNLDETIDFLRVAGYALSPISQRDVIVEYFIKKRDFNVIKIDIVLFDYGLEPLSGT